jgi:TonB family protein
VRTRQVSAFGSLLSMSAAAAAAPAPLNPTGPWDVNYGETQCAALRAYGDKANPTTLAIRPAPNGETYELLVGRKGGGPDYAGEYEGSVDFGHGPINAWLLHYGDRKARLTIDQFRISAQEMLQARTAGSVRLRSRGGPEVSFTLANMPALLKSLETCTADLKQYWNMEPPERDKIAVPAKGDVRDVFNPHDYPSDAMTNHQEGTVQYLLLIDETGKVADCHVVKASGVPVLDGMGCQVIAQRARFKPALDAQGKPIKSSYVTPAVQWRIG